MIRLHMSAEEKKLAGVENSPRLYNQHFCRQ